MKKEIIKYLAGRFVPAVVNLALIVLAIRYLGPEEYGRYSLLLFTILMIVTVSFHWIQVSIVRFVGTVSRESNLVVTRFFFLTLLSALVSVLLVMLPAVFFFHLSWAETALIMLFTFINHFYLLHLAIFQANHNSIRMAIMEGTDHLVIIVVLILGLFVFSMGTYLLLFTSMLLGVVVAEVLRLLIRVRGLYHLEVYRSVWDNRFSRRVFEFGSAMTLWLLLSHILIAADRFILYGYEGFMAAGSYSALKDMLFKAVTFTATPIYLSYQHKALEEWNSKHQAEAQSLIREALTFEMMIFIILFIVFMIAKSFIFNVVLRLPEMDNWLIYIPLLVSAFLWQVCLLIQKPLELLSGQKYVLMVLGTGAVLNIVANLILVPQYSMVASALIMMVSGVIMFLFLVLIRKSKTGAVPA